MTKSNKPADYALYVSADGKQIVVCGRQRQMLDLLISHRAMGNGLRKGGSQARLWNMAEAAAQLAKYGVLIGKQGMRFKNEHSASGRGSVCLYYLLEPWRKASDDFDIPKEAEAASGKRTKRPEQDGPFRPFLCAASIKSIVNIELLNPAKLLPGAKPILAAQAEAMTEAA